MIAGHCVLFLFRVVKSVAADTLPDICEVKGLAGQVG